jgi:hypothetical protein
MTKATSPLALDKVYNSTFGDWFEIWSSVQDPWLQKLLNQLLRLHPERREEICKNAACHRTTLVFGRCWNHRNLSDATHRNLDRFFGGCSMHLIDLLKRMGSRGEVSTNEPGYTELTTPENVERLRGLPFLFFVGGDSAVLSPRATETIYERSIDKFGISDGFPGSSIQYRRRVVPGYEHLDCWMGRNAWRDVYPFVREEVDRVVRVSRIDSGSRLIALNSLRVEVYCGKSASQLLYIVYLPFPLLRLRRDIDHEHMNILQHIRSRYCLNVRERF